MSIFCLFYPVQIAFPEKLFVDPAPLEYWKKYLPPENIFHYLNTLLENIFYNLHPFIPWKLFPAPTLSWNLIPAFSTRNVFGTYTASRIHRTSRNFLQRCKTLGIFLISKIPWNLLSPVFLLFMQIFPTLRSSCTFTFCINSSMDTFQSICNLLKILCNCRDCAASPNKNCFQ